MRRYSFWLLALRGPPGPQIFFRDSESPSCWLQVDMHSVANFCDYDVLIARRNRPVAAIAQ